MTRTRRLFTLAAAVSAVLCAATVVTLLATTPARFHIARAVWFDFADGDVWVMHRTAELDCG